ncbi:MAG TPA: IPT/TIG domain-containing protein, partial [Geobacteraceae bacterium]|nr:IPT/TIG domain-containing protein [Geobacteraceae bacterium]
MKNRLELLTILFAVTVVFAACGGGGGGGPQTPAISDVAPSHGLPGTTVIISGTNFNPTPASNVVKFNGTTAAVIDSTSIQIVATVPKGATSGPITVTEGSNSATSPSSFTVTRLLGGSVQG